MNEKEVQKALDRMLTEHQGVAIVIAHRLTTIKNCNKIIVSTSTIALALALALALAELQRSVRPAVRPSVLLDGLISWT